MEKVFESSTFAAAMAKAKREIKKEVANAHFYAEHFDDEHLTILNVLEPTDYFAEIWHLKDGTFEVVIRND